MPQALYGRRQEAEEPVIVVAGALIAERARVRAWRLDTASTNRGSVTGLANWPAGGIGRQRRIQMNAAQCDSEQTE